MQAANFVSALKPPMMPVAVLELKPSGGANTQAYQFAKESAFPGQCL